jgi:hypothetical protein
VIARLAALTAVVGAAACPGTTEIAPQPIVYELIGVEWPSQLAGEELPDLSGVGTLELATDGTCRRTVALVLPASDPDPSALEWPCTWTRRSNRLELTWGEAVPPQPPLAGYTSTGTVDGVRLELEIQTGIVCVTTPCPTGWLEVYRQVASASG